MNIQGYIIKRKNVVGKVDGTTDFYKKAIKDNTTARHTHKNKEILDEISKNNIITTVSSADETYKSGVYYCNVRLPTSNSLIIPVAKPGILFVSSYGVGSTLSDLTSWNITQCFYNGDGNIYIRTANISSTVDSETGEDVFFSKITTIWKEANIHSHQNKEVLDGITNETLKQIHVHNNKDLLDSITKTDKENFEKNTEARHTHSNEETLKKITPEIYEKWTNFAYGKANSLSYFFASNYNNSLYGEIETKNAVIADYIFKNNSMGDITIDLSSCYSLIGGFLNSEVESLTFKNGTPALKKANSLLSGSKKLKSVSGLDLSNATDVKYLHKDCEMLEGEISYQIPHATDISYICYNCKKLTSAYLKCDNVTLATGAFTGCYSLTNLILEGMTASFDISDTTIEDLSDLFNSLGETEGGIVTLADGGSYTVFASAKSAFLNKGWKYTDNARVLLLAEGT